MQKNANSGCFWARAARQLLDEQLPKSEIKEGAVAPSNLSAVVRMDVPPLATLDEFVGQEKEVRTCLSGVSDMLDFYRRNSGALAWPVGETGAGSPAG